MNYEKELVKAYRVATRSPDPSTQNGAIVYGWRDTAIGEGCNEFTAGVKISDDRLVRPLKYSFIEHAERNAIYDVFNSMDSTKQAHEFMPKVMVCPWAACTDCARAIVQSGVRKLVRHKQAMERKVERWAESIALADEIMLEAGVHIVDVDAEFLGAPTIRHLEELWTP